MGAEPSTSSLASEGWARLEGQVIDERFPVRRYLGSSDHSVVFLIGSAKLAPSEMALKLVPIGAARAAELQLARWRAAAEVTHPHLVRIFDVGRCNVGGVVYLYVVMEYADQDLAQLLQRRALTEDEVREMLPPALAALEFLHERKLVQGQLKPSNVLVVGDQLKLASDLIRPAGELGDVRLSSAYDAPEEREGGGSTAGDVWALGITLCEALTRRQPLGLVSGPGSVVLPPDLPLAFDEITAWCLRRQPSDRPRVAQIDAWLNGGAIGAARMADDVAGAADDPAGTAGDVAELEDVSLELPALSASPPPVASVQPAAPSTISVVPPAAAVDSELAAGLTPSAKTAATQAVPPPPAKTPQPPRQAAPPASATTAPTSTTAPLASAAPPRSTPTPPAGTIDAPTPPAPPKQSAPVAKPSPPQAPSSSPAQAATSAPAARSAPSAARGLSPSATQAIPPNSTSKSAVPTKALSPKPAAPSPSSAAPAAAVPKSTPPIEVRQVEARPAVLADASEPASAQPLPRRSTVPLVIGFVAVIAVVWGGIRLFAPHTPASAPASSSAQTSVPQAPVAEQSPSTAAPPLSKTTPSAAPSAPSATRAPRAGASQASAASGVARQPSASVAGKKKPSAAAHSSAPQADATIAGVHEVLPDVPQRARRTIRGTVRVSVRVIIEQDGSVFAALADQRSSSRYFERLAIDAAKKWTFPAAESSAQRLMLVKFDFTRDGTTARAVPAK